MILLEKTVLALSSGKIDKYEYLTYWLLGKLFEKQANLTNDLGKISPSFRISTFSEKQLPSMQYFISEKVSNTETINEIENIIKQEKKGRKKYFTNNITKHIKLTRYYKIN